MDLAQTFRKLAFYQVLLGIVTFCYAEANPGMLLIAGSFVVLSRYIAEGPSGRPLPKWAMNTVALIAFFWLLIDILYREPNMLISMGHFTMCLQVLLMFTRRTNREYGHLLILSLLQMIGASVLSVSIIYGILLAVYCVLALMTMLVFHLKNSSDTVFEANRSAASDRDRVTRPKAVVGPGHRWHWRTHCAMIAVVCALTAACVFILSPRSEASPMADRSESALGPRQIGFSQQVRLDRQPIGVSSEEPVMNLTITEYGSEIQDRSWLLRGAALDEYDEQTRSWKRGESIATEDRRVEVASHGVNLAMLPYRTPMAKARVTLRQIGHRNLFTHLPVTHLESDSITSVVFNRYDQQLSSGSAVYGAVIYTISWPVRTAPRSDLVYQDLGQSTRPFGMGMGMMYDRPRTKPFRENRYARGWPTQREKIAQYALQVLDENGLTRDPLLPYTPDDGRIANVLAEHLRRTCTYQLGGPRLHRAGDPTIDFIFETRSGHCELFASALAAMTRSIGMQARVVTGFRASEYNQIGGYYVVRQSDAHAWTEINLGPGIGWQSFDATPADEMDNQARTSRGWMTVLREAYEHLEFGWIRSVVAYDTVTRKSLLERLNQSLKDMANDPNGLIGQVTTFVHLLPTAWQQDKTNTVKAIGSALLAAILTIGLLRFVMQHRRKLTLLKIGSLDSDKQREMVRQLSFYLDMTQLLERHGFVRPNWQNPRDYALSLIQQQPDQMRPVLDLTDLFYRGRYGQTPLDRQDQKTAREQLKRLEAALADNTTGR